jgi:hypothetical protein
MEASRLISLDDITLEKPIPNSFYSRVTFSETLMPHWLSGPLLAAMNYIPGLFVAEDDPKFQVVRGMWGLVVLVAVAMAAPTIWKWITQLTAYIRGQ